MGISADDTSVLPFLKIRYPNGIAWKGIAKSKILNLIKKNKDAGGEGERVVISVGATRGGSSNYQSAYANQGPSQDVALTVNWRTEYQLARVKNKALLSTKGDKNAIKSLLEKEFDRVGYAFGRAMSVTAWSNGGGSLFRLTTATTIASPTITVTDKSQLVKLEKGMKLQFASDDGTGTSPVGLRAATELTVNSIDYVAGTATLSANLNTIPGIANTDYVFRSGDYANRMTGIPGFIVAGSVTSDPFFGLDRTVDRVRCAGYYKAGDGGLKEQFIKDVCAEAALFGANPTKAFLNPLDWNEFEKEIGNAKVKELSGTKAELGFKAISVETAVGTIEVTSEIDVPAGKCWIINPEDFSLSTMGDCPRNLNVQGQGQMVRVQGEDAYQYEIGGYGNFICSEPGSQIAGAF